MAGLLGMQGGQGMGLLGGMQQQPEWAQKLGLISAALKDAAANFSGREDPGALQAWQQNSQQTQIRQKLMNALQSPDPAIRQQGYQAAAMLGIPTDSFQKQQASQQLPQLLQSMRPSQQTLPSQSAPLNNGSQITTAPINFEAPGLNIQEAIGQAPPELQAQYAPDIIKQQMQMAQNAVRSATAEEKQAAGLDPRTPAQIDANGKLSPVTDPNMVTDYQRQTLARQQDQLGLSRAQFGETVRHNQAAEANTGRGSVPPGYRAKPDGSLEYIPGGPADPTKGAGKKAPTEDQNKNNQLYTRAKQQLPIVLENFDALGQIGNQIGSQVPGTTAFTSTAYQRADGGLRDIAASYLYSVSGATANPGEVANLVMTVRPKVGDSEQTKADKRDRISQMVDSIKLRAQPTAPTGLPQSPANLPRLPQQSSGGWTVTRRK